MRTMELTIMERASLLGLRPSSSEASTLSGPEVLVPEMLVQDELKTRLRQQYCAVPRVFENFYAITMRRHSQSAVMQVLRVGD